MDNEDLLWILSYAAAINARLTYPKDVADKAVENFRHTEVFCPATPPEPFDDEDPPF